LHDFFRGIDGGGRVVATLSKAFGWPIVAGEIEDEKFLNQEEIKAFSLKCLRRSLLSRFSQTLAYINCFRKFSWARDFIVFSGQLAPLAAKKTQGHKILYCHTPPRILYDAREETLAQLSFPGRALFRLLLFWYRSLYEKALREMDVLIANSQNVRRRLQKYVALDAEVIYPPVKVEKFKWISQEPFFLSTARLAPLKRVDIVIEAFKRMPHKHLVVVSGGPEEGRLKALAAGAPNIQFLGWVSDRELCDLLGKCLATVYIPKDEDFGLSPIESMAAGKPVIGVAEGGLLETVIHRETGILLPSNPSPEDLIRAVEFLTPTRALEMKEACERRATLFSEENFIERFKELVFGSTSIGSWLW